MDTDQTLRLAVIDDDDLYRDYVGSLLRKGGDVEVFDAADGAGLFDILSKREVDCVLLDYDLGRETGLGINEELKERHPDGPPVVMLTGDGRERTVIKALRGGVADYVPKRDLNVNELLRAVREAVRRHRQEGAERAEVARLVQRSAFDPRTGLQGRAALDARLAAADRATRAGRPFALFLIEPAGFAYLASTLGPSVGDRALKAVAARLQAATPADDFAGHLAGDTLAYVLDANATADTVSRTAARLAAALTFAADFDQASLRLSPVIAVAAHPADGGAEAMLAAADERLAALRRKADAAAVTSGAFAPRGGDGEAAGEGGDGVRREGDRRKEVRQRVFKRGQIALPGGSVVDCTVRDMSGGGAKLRIDEFFDVPARFELVIVSAGVKRQVAKRWQIRNDLGVEYLG